MKAMRSRCAALTNCNQLGGNAESCAVPGLRQRRKPGAKLSVGVITAEAFPEQIREHQQPAAHVRGEEVGDQPEEIPDGETLLCHAFILAYPFARALTDGFYPRLMGLY